MASYINCRDTLFKQTNLTSIRGQPNFEPLHKLWNEIKATAKPVCSNIGGGSHGHIGLLLANAQYALILNTLFVYPTHPGPLIIPDGNTAHMKSNMCIAHTKVVHLLCEVTVVDQALAPNIVSTVEEAYLTDIRNRTTNPINDNVANLLTNLQENYGQLMSHELLEHKGTVKKTNHHSHEPIASVFSIIEEILEFADIDRTSYT